MECEVERMRFPCITVHHPHAALLVLGEKEFETRSWPTKYRGPILIHESQSRATWHMNLPWQIPEMWQALKRIWTKDGKGLRIRPGAFIGVVDLIDCILITPEFVATLSEKEKLFGDFTPGRYAWKVANPRPWVSQADEPGTEPIFGIKGKQRIWYYDCPLVPDDDYNFSACVGIDNGLCKGCRLFDGKKVG